MPQAVSKKQYRMMMAIAHNGPIHGRQPPKYIAEKYSKPDKEAPESKNNDRGGRWDKHKEGSKEEQSKREKKHERLKDKKNLKKAFEEFYNGQGAGTIVLNEEGHILVGKDPHTGEWQLPGGHVDPGEDFEDAARRELREEAHVVADDLVELAHFRTEGNDSKSFLVQSWRGEPKDSAELIDVSFVEPHVLVDRNLREASKLTLEAYFNSPLKKNSLQNLVAAEKLAKNILRGADQRTAVYDVSHGEALKLVGNGCFRWLKSQVADMGDEDFKELHLDTYTISVRKHLNDVYSGRISDGHKVIHQFTNKSLPQLCADVMSVFEWYSNDDEHVFNILDEANLPDDAIFGGLNELTNNYTKHNLANIYTEMENIRQEMRHGNAVDLQQVEEKIMKLFDKLEDQMHTVVSQHNKLSQDAGKEIETLEQRLRELAVKIDEMGKKPSTVEAFQTGNVNPDKVYNSHYNYLTKPTVSVDPSGKISISFDREWTDMEKSNYLKDLKAVLIKKRK
jgi:8-oxo-dGTP pyrophosphatase MutT (NUDIX family)